LITQLSYTYLATMVNPPFGVHPQLGTFQICKALSPSVRVACSQDFCAVGYGCKDGAITRYGQVQTAAPPPIHSLAYFIPVIGELLAQPIPENYLDYLRLNRETWQARNRLRPKPPGCLAWRPIPHDRCSHLTLKCSVASMAPRNRGARPAAAFVET
jgi:hypothetical protein